MNPKIPTKAWLSYDSMLLSASQIVSKAMIGMGCDLIMDAYKMEVPVMETSCIPIVGDMISKQKWTVDVKTVKKMLEFEKDMHSINPDDLKWLQPNNCNVDLEDMTLPLPLHNSLHAFLTNGLKDLLISTEYGLSAKICDILLGVFPSYMSSHLQMFLYNPALLQDDYDPLDEDDILDPFSLISMYCMQLNISEHMYRQGEVESGNVINDVALFKPKDQACSGTKEKHSERNKSNVPIKTIRHIKASNNNTASLNEQRIGLGDEATPFTGAFTHLECSASLQREVDDYNHAKECTGSSMSRLMNNERSLWQDLNPNSALHSIYQRSSPALSTNDAKPFAQEIGRSESYSTVNNMTASITDLSSSIISSAFPSNSRSPCYGDGNVRSTLCCNTKDGQLQNNTRKRSIIESMKDRDSGSRLKNNRRKLSLLSPNLSKFSRPSDAADISQEFSVPLSANYNSDYEGIDITRAGFSIMNDRPKDVLRDMPSLQHMQVEAYPFKVADRVNEFVRLRKRTTPFLEQ
ncbi:hypothetical protein INT43_002118 [Umbelopsis isabellina]|uniref:Uncharacterized protein n=1 Tax=Mortierella isabellina TaxID=91625 RepID=A0A8H7PSA0_MORIS|nr:hypothetical protein INT43_002118 [Umbelopsis isabellina]